MIEFLLCQVAQYILSTNLMSVFFEVVAVDLLNLISLPFPILSLSLIYLAFFIHNTFYATWDRNYYKVRN